MYIPGLILIFSNASATLNATAGAKWISATRGISYPYYNDSDDDIYLCKLK
jgi:hypothetical protein